MSHSAASPQPQRRYVVISTGLPVGRTIADALHDQGAGVSLVSDGAQTGQSDLHRFSCDFADIDALSHAIGEADAAIGGADLFVLSAMAATAAQSKPLVELSDDEWTTACGDAILDLLHMFKGVSTALSTRPAGVAVIGASFAYAGAKGLTALTAALEGQRGMTKSVARQWGARGVAVNWIALAAEAFGAAFEGAEAPFKMDAVQIALHRRPSLDGDLPGVLAFLASPEGRALTGANINLDGGEWMTP